MFEWISGARNKAADCLSRLVKLPYNTDSHSHDAHSHKFGQFSIQYTRSSITATPNNPQELQRPSPKPKPLTSDRHEALLQMQRMDPFCKHISKRLSNGKAPQHEADLFIHVKGLLYKHIMDANQKCLALIIPKAWKYTVLVEAHDKLWHQGGTCTYCLTKCQY